MTPGLYGIIDVDFVTTAFLNGAAHAFADAGVEVVQLRGKSLDTRSLVDAAQQVGHVIQGAGGRFVVDERVDVARVVGADGVHLGPHDLSPQQARRLLGPGALIGVSTHSLHAARAAADAGYVDYVSFGPIFATTRTTHAGPPLGLDRLCDVCAQLALPVVAIGGIGLQDCASVRAAGATGVAMISGVLRGDLVGNLSAAVEACS